MTQTLTIAVGSLVDSVANACDFCWTRARATPRWGVGTYGTAFEGARMCGGCIVVFEEGPAVFRSALRSRWKELPPEDYDFHRELLRSILEGHLEIRIERGGVV